MTKSRTFEEWRHFHKSREVGDIVCLLGSFVVCAAIGFLWIFRDTGNAWLAIYGGILVTGGFFGGFVFSPILRYLDQKYFLEPE